ncbi:MAG: protein translocase subunit SecD [Gammaproteobacteria bacterium]|nr:protein translocase subunit SecD [Gammaproteobacteria bacterium]
MNRYPLWRYLLLLLVLAAGLIYALPNLYGSDPALQISADRGATITVGILDRVEKLLREESIEYNSSVLEADDILIRFGDTDSQLKAKDLVQATLGTDYQVALNLAPAAPAWLERFGAEPMYLGLDLRGGVHFLLDVDMDAAVAKAEERYVGDLRALLRDEKVRYQQIEPFAALDGDSGVVAKFGSAAERDQAADLARRNFPDLRVESDSDGELFLVRVRLTEVARRDTRSFALKQNITTLRNRVNELGVAEPVIQQQGDNRIIVQLPGVQDTTRAKAVLGATATLEFKLVDEQNELESGLSRRVPPGSRRYDMRRGGDILLFKRTILTGEYITSAASGIDPQNGDSIVSITLDGRGARVFERITGENIGKRMAVIFIENRTQLVRAPDGTISSVKRRVEEVITAPVIQDTLGRRFQITGLDSPAEARDLALLLRAGSLAAPMDIVEERTVGPSLGQDNIDKGLASVVIGLVLVLAFMAFWYKGFGLVANLALVVNLVLIVAALSLFQATLTLPGIAGVVLTVGMAVDANVLIFERIREELAVGNTPQASINAGYAKAFSTIMDANITTLIASVVLFAFGTGPIKGFGVTLSIGILTSMFTAILGTRAVVNLVWGNRRLSRLSI